VTTIADPRHVGALRLDGKRALITGATKGIGADIARTFAAAGASLVLSGRDRAELSAAESALTREYGCRVSTATVDLAEPDAPMDLARRATEAFGGLDILVNNAGISHPQPVTEIDPQKFDETIAVNLRAPALLAAAVGRAMVAQGTGGSIITVASAAALSPLPDHYAYCASKAGLVMATKVLARELGRYVRLTNYASGLCMPEIAVLAGLERLDMMLNDSMYGILFRDINMQRTFCDQYFSRRICAFAEIIINTGEDNYITTADADEAAHTVIASQLINETFARLAGMKDELIGFGHSFEIDPAREDTLLREFAMAMMVRELFPKSPIKYMPPTKHKEGDIFFSHAYDVMADLVAITTRQGIQLLGMMTEAMHNPFLMDRYVALKSAAYVYRAARHLGDEIAFKPDGIVARRQREVFDEALALLEEVAKDGMMAAIGKARFGDTARTPEGGKGLDGVVERAPGYFNPFLEILEGKA